MRDDSAWFAHLRSLDSQQPVVFLCSGGNDPDARFSIAAIKPFLILRSKDYTCQLETAQRTYFLDADPFDVLNNVFHSVTHIEKSHIPFIHGGAIGYLSYELKNLIEILPQTATDDLGLPEMFFLFPSRISIFDRHEQTLREIGIQMHDEKGSLLEPISYPVETNVRPTGFHEHSFISTPNDYRTSIKRIIEYITAGDVYQVNLSQRLLFPGLRHPFDVWEKLFRQNPAPFFAYIAAGDHQILSTSPERFLRGNNGVLHTQPIKGTRPRGKTRLQDQVLLHDLLVNEKDDAELSMIVDLMRNDLGKICETGSINVIEHKRADSYANVHHLSSLIEGRLREGISYADILRATFPPGSVTGCPKIRAMQIIDELEVVVRHVYTGSIGWLGFDGNFDLNVAIRTAVTVDDRCILGVGGGIVYDSVPSLEYEETLHKGKSFTSIILRADDP